MNSFPGENLCSQHGRTRHFTAGNDCYHVRRQRFPVHPGRRKGLGGFAVNDYGGLVHNKGAVLGIDILHRISSHADIGRFFIQKQGIYQLCGLETVAGKVNPHVRNGRHGRNILCGMMAHAKFSIADASADAYQRHIGIGVCHIHFGLFVAAGGEKAGRGEAEGLFAAFCHSGRDADQILFCNPYFHGLLREPLEKRSHGSGTSGIAAEYGDIPICLRFF